MMVVVWVYGLMGFTGYQINSQTVTIGALSLGLGVDYAVHFSIRLEEEVEHNPFADPHHWVANASATTGRAMWMAALTTVTVQHPGTVDRVAPLPAAIVAEQVASLLKGMPTDAIKIGNTNPYSGPASAYGQIGRTVEAYFEMINAEGGVNGRQIEFISYDDAYSPPKTVEQVRRRWLAEELVWLGQSRPQWDVEP